MLYNTTDEILLLVGFFPLSLAIKNEESFEEVRSSKLRTHKGEGSLRNKHYVSQEGQRNEGLSRWEQKFKGKKESERM